MKMSSATKYEACRSTYFDQGLFCVLSLAHVFFLKEFSMFPGRLRLFYFPTLKFCPSVFCFAIMFYVFVACSCVILSIAHVLCFISLLGKSKIF